MLQLFEEHVGGVIVFHLYGSLTMTNLAAAASAGAEARFGALDGTEAARVVVDIGEVDAVTTPGITLMLKTACAVRERGGMMVFANPTPQVRGVFERCGLDVVLDFAGDVAAAVQAVRACEPGVPLPQLPRSIDAEGGNPTQ